MLAISLMRMGAKKSPFYRVVVKEKRSKRDGKYLENLGTYNPMLDPADVRLDHERIQYWIGVGAQPTETVASLIKNNPVQTEEERAAMLQARSEKRVAAEAAKAEARKTEAARLAAEKAEAEKAAAEASPAEAAPSEPTETEAATIVAAETEPVESTAVEAAEATEPEAATEQAVEPVEAAAIEVAETTEPKTAEEQTTEPVETAAVETTETEPAAETGGEAPEAETAEA